MEVFLLLLLVVFSLSFAVYPIQTTTGSHADVQFFMEFAVLFIF